MSNHSKKAQQAQSLFTLMDSELEITQEYDGLSNLIASLKEHQANYTSEEFEEAQTLTNNLMKSVCQFLLDKNDSNVLQLLQKSLSLYPSKSSKKQKNPLSPHGVLDSQDDDLDSDEDNQNEDELIDRIADQLNIKTPTTEETLVKTISNKFNEVARLKSDLIKGFNLPKETQSDDLVDALKSKFAENSQNNTSDENLRIQISQLSKELENENKQMKSLRSKEQQKDLAIMELKNKITELQNTEIMNDISTEIVENRIDIERYKSEMSSLKKENEKLCKVINKAQKKNGELKKLLKEFNGKNQELLEKNDELQKEVEELKEKEQVESVQPTSENTKKDDLQIPFDQLLDQYEKQSKEIYEESSHRMQLLDSVQKLLTINSILDQRLQQATNRVSELENIRDNMFKEQAEIKQQLVSRSMNVNNSENQDSNDSEIDESKEYVDESLVDHLKEIVQPANDSLRDSLLGTIENPDFTISKKVISVVSTLVNSIQHTESYDENTEVLEQRNQLLLSTVGSLMQFLNDLIQSPEMRSWAFSEYSCEDSKSLLITQVQAIQQFMKENCIQYLEDDETILSSFIEKNDPLQLEQSVKHIIAPYEKVRTNEGKDLLILLQQSLAAGMLIKSYAAQLTNSWLEQDNEKKELQSRIDQLEKANEQYADELREEVEKAQECIESYCRAQNQKPQLQISYASNEDDQNVATSTLDSCLVSLNPEEDENVKQLKDKLAKNKKKLQKSKSYIKSLKSTIKSEVEKGNLPDYAINILDNLDGKETISYEQNSQSSKTLQEIEKDSKEKEKPSDSENDKKEEKNKNEKRDEESEITEVQPNNNDDKKLIEKLTKENKHLKEKLEKMNQKACEELKKLNAQMKQKYKKNKLKSTQKIKELTELLEKSEQQKEENSKFRDENEQLKQENRQLQIDNKLINAKLVSRNEEIKREKQIADSQWKLRQFNLEASVQDQIEKHRRENDQQLYQFLISVCQLFRKHADVNQTVNCENVLAILTEVANKLDKYTKQAYEFEKVNDVINFKSGEDPSKKIDQLVKENRKLASQVRSLSNENGELKKNIKEKDSAIISRAPAKDWEEWALPLYRKVSNSKATKPTSYILRKGIENALQRVIDEDENSQSPSSVWDNDASYQNASLLHLAIIAIASIRLQKLVNSYKSNQDLSKTKFKAAETKFSAAPAPPKFVRNPSEV